MNKSASQDIHLLTGHLFREYHGKMVSSLTRKYGYHELDNCRDAVQEAFEAALLSWKFKGIPPQALAWLLKVARNKLLHKIKREATGNTHLRSFQKEAEPGLLAEEELEESQLRLLLFFSRIALSERNKLIVCLHFLGGFGYAEIGSALLLRTETVKKVIARSSAQIREFALNYENFTPEIPKENTALLLRIIYLLFNEGYKTSKKTGTISYDLCYEAIRLAKLMLHTGCTSPDLYALLALMFFNSSRFPARIGTEGWIPLEEQDRSLWNKSLIAEGLHYLKVSKNESSQLSSYYLEALISSVHCSAPTYASTDWKTLVYLYRQWERLSPGSIAISLNRIVAQSNIGNSRDCIAEIESLCNTDLPAEMYFSVYASKAHLYAKLKDWPQARACYTKAMTYARNVTDQNFIRRKLQALPGESPA